MSIVVINGTNNASSRVNAIAHYISEKVQATTINVFDLPANDLLRTNFASQAIQDANETVEKANVIVLLTPIYKASFTGILKTYIDLLPEKAFVGKTIIPIIVGGTERHQLVIDFSLKPLASALGATQILQGVFVHDQQIQRNNEAFDINSEVITRIDEQLHQSTGTKQQFTHA